MFSGPHSYPRDFILSLANAAATEEVPKKLEGLFVEFPQLRKPSLDRFEMGTTSSIPLSSEAKNRPATVRSEALPRSDEVPKNNLVHSRSEALPRSNEVPKNNLIHSRSQALPRSNEVPKNTAPKLTKVDETAKPEMVWDSQREEWVAKK